MPSIIWRPAAREPVVILFRRLIAVFLLAGVAGCSKPADKPAAESTPREPATASVSAAAPFPRRDITVADRARWFARLGWPQGCEDAFKQTRLTDDGGLEIYALASGASIAVVRCALGAYQPTSVVLRFDEHNPSKAVTVLEFPGFESMDGKTLAPVRMRELSGEIAWLEDAKALVVLALARQLGDCGTWARYALSDDGPKLTAFAAHVSCPENPGQRVNPTPGEPPKSWKTIPIP